MESFVGAVRRRTFICYRNIQISASSITRDRIRSTTIQPMSLQRSLIAHDHRPILDRLPSRIRFATGTVDAFDSIQPSSRRAAPPIYPDLIYDRHRPGSDKHRVQCTTWGPQSTSDPTRILLICSTFSSYSHRKHRSMSSLADLAELRGFFSYSREDDEDSNGALSAL